MSLPDMKRERYSKDMKKKSSKPTLSLHSLLGALSFWGTASRGLLFGFVSLAVFAIALSEARNSIAVDIEIMTFAYVLGSFLLLDFGYVMVSKAYTVSTGIDRFALCVADLFIAALYFVPSLVVSSRISLTTDPLLFVVFVPVVVLTLRMLVGILFGSRR